MSGYNDWFVTDKEGFAKMVERKGKTAVVLELIQNAWDEQGVTRVVVTLEDAPMRGRSLLVVTDDAPDGFADLTHAFTLFAPSSKVKDATKRGRFNLGEKMVLAICDSATVLSTRGGWEFTETGRKRLRKTRIAGSRIEAIIRLTDKEREEVCALIGTLIPPAGITTILNGAVVVHRKPVREFEVNLPTEMADADGILRRTRRNTTVRLYEPLTDEVPSLYEMGIPVVETEGRWHLDIAQKVPLNFNRDNVTPAYLRDLRVAVLNATHDLLTPEDATSVWVKEAASDDRAEQVAVSTVVRRRYGDKVVAYDPSDPDANKEAVLQGYTVVSGGSLSKGEWEQVRKAGVMQPAGQVTPSHSSVETAPDGRPPIPKVDWRPGQHRIAEYARALARDLLDIDIEVSIYRVLNGKAAWYGDRSLSFNALVLGNGWFDRPDQHRVDALLIHEFAHHRVKEHLSEKFHNECCRLGALLRDCTVRLEESRV